MHTRVPVCNILARRRSDALPQPWITSSFGGQTERHIWRRAWRSGNHPNHEIIETVHWVRGGRCATNSLHTVSSPWNFAQINPRGTPLYALRTRATRSADKRRYVFRSQWNPFNRCTSWLRRRVARILVRYLSLARAPPIDRSSETVHLLRVEVQGASRTWHQTATASLRV